MHKKTGVRAYLINASNKSIFVTNMLGGIISCVVYEVTLSKLNTLASAIVALILILVNIINYKISVKNVNNSYTRKQTVNKIIKASVVICVSILLAIIVYTAVSLLLIYYVIIH